MIQLGPTYMAIQTYFTSLTMMSQLTSYLISLSLGPTPFSCNAKVPSGTKEILQLPKLLI